MKVKATLAMLELHEPQDCRQYPVLEEVVEVEAEVVVKVKLQTPDDLNCTTPYRHCRLC